MPGLRLFLLPPEGTDLSGELDYSTEPTVDKGTAIVVGRPTETGFEDLASIVHLTTGPTFAGSEEPILIGGRDLIQPGYDIPGSMAAEELLDGTWIEYSMQDGATELEEVVAATSHIDDEVVFATTPSGIEVLGRIADVSLPQATHLSHYRQSVDSESDASPQDWFTIITTPSVDDEVLLLALVAASADRIEIQGRPGYVTRFPQLDGQPTGTGLAWRYPTGHVVAVFTYLAHDQAIEFAEQLTIVSEETWNAELSSIGEATPDASTD